MFDPGLTRIKPCPPIEQSDCRAWNTVVVTVVVIVDVSVDVTVVLIVEDTELETDVGIVDD